MNMSHITPIMVMHEKIADELQALGVAKPVTWHDRTQMYGRFIWVTPRSRHVKSLLEVDNRGATFEYNGNKLDYFNHKPEFLSLLAK